MTMVEAVPKRKRLTKRQMKIQYGEQTRLAMLESGRSVPVGYGLKRHANGGGVGIDAVVQSVKNIIRERSTSRLG